MMAAACVLLVAFLIVMVAALVMLLQEIREMAKDEMERDDLLARLVEEVYEKDVRGIMED